VAWNEPRLLCHLTWRPSCDTGTCLDVLPSSKVHSVLLCPLPQSSEAHFCTWRVVGRTVSRLGRVTCCTREASISSSLTCGALLDCVGFLAACAVWAYAYILSLLSRLDLSAYSCGIICSDLMSRGAVIFDYARNRVAFVPSRIAAQWWMDK
jgi:hypothetical protein